MDLEELRSVQRTEREKDSLQHLRDSFYEDVAEYIQDLKARRDRAAEEADDPFGSDDVRRLTDEIETAEEVAEAIYERRVGKVVKLSSFAAADMSVEREGLTDQELQLFDDLVERIKQNKTSVLDILSGETPVDTADTGSTAKSPASVGSPEPAAASEPSSPESAAADSGGMLADAMGGDSNEDETSANSTPEPHAGETEEPSEAPPEAPPNESRTAGSPERTDEGGHTPVDPEPAPPGVSETSDADGDSTSPESGTPDDSPQFDPDRVTVRITQDVGEVLGADDREYELASEDVVTLPSVNAEPLLQKDAAEKLE